MLSAAKRLARGATLAALVLALLLPPALQALGAGYYLGTAG